MESIVRTAKGDCETENARQQYTAVQMIFQYVILIMHSNKTSTCRLLHCL